MSDEQDRAEALDVDQLDDNPFQPDDLPGESFPPDHPLGARVGAFAEDGSVAEDDVAERSRREEPEPFETDVRPGRASRTGADGPVDLVAETELDELDEEAELLGEAGDPPGLDAPAEVAAVHVITEGEATGRYDDGLDA